MKHISEKHQYKYIHLLYLKLFLESLRYVDEIHIFDEITPLNLIKELEPDIIVKGGDYDPASVVGSDLARVEIFKYIDGVSTTEFIEKIKKL